LFVRGSVGSREALSRNVAEVGQRTCSSLRHLLRLFAMNPAACDAVLADASLADTRSESAAELIRQLKVYICNCYRGLKCPPQKKRCLEREREKKNYSPQSK